MLKMCQPAWCDIEDRIADLDGIIQEHKTASYLSIEAELADPTGFVPPKRLKFYEETKRLIRHYSDIRDQFERFLNSRDTDLGHVFAGSGLFSVKKSTIDPTTTLSPTIRDWALISLSPNRTPDNTVSTMIQY